MSTLARLARLARLAPLVLVAAFASGPLATPSAQAPFALDETAIADVHAALRARQLTCRTLVDAYLRRIAANDQRGPALNAIVVTNPHALQEADELDRRFRQGGLIGPLHCVPAIVKDNFETIGLQSADGSLSLQGFVSDKDAFLVKRIRAAGAIVLAKSNMAEFAFSPYETVNSLKGTTKNPYALDRVPAGSSGGTAAAVAANFGLVGLGSDTGNSIRGPSAHNALVGIRSTMGLTSRAGVIPLSYLADIAGPMTRTVADAVAVFQVIVGEDPEDPVTARARGRVIPNYSTALVTDGLKGSRVGILRAAYLRDTTDPEVVRVFQRALDDMAKAGATIVDEVQIAAVRRTAGAGVCRGFRYDIDDYLASRGQRAPVHSLGEIVKSGKFHASIARRLQQALQGTPGDGPDSEACRAETAYREAYGQAITTTMDAMTLDALVYPTWSNPPRLIGDLTSPHGDNSQTFSPISGFPAISVPMGYTRDDTLPAGMTLLGRAWDEARLIRLAYGYEQATKHRKRPALTIVK